MSEEEKQLPCADKLAFDTKKQAQAVATSAAWQHGVKPKVRPYVCQYCNLWHLASDYN